MNEEKLLDENSKINDNEDFNPEEGKNNNINSISQKKERKSEGSFLFEKNPNQIYEESYEDYLQRESITALNKTIEDIYNNNNKFNHINPIRISKAVTKYRRPDYKRHPKELAIKELITNLRTQYIIFNIRNFVRSFEIRENPSINKKKYKISIMIRNMSLYIYGFIMLFEKPWFCYKDTTIPLPNSFKFIENCEDKVIFNNVPFIHNNVLRVIEIILTLSISITQIMKYKVEYSLKQSNTGVNKCYNIIQVMLFTSLFLCLIDSIISFADLLFIYI